MKKPYSGAARVHLDTATGAHDSDRASWSSNRETRTISHALQSNLSLDGGSIRMRPGRTEHFHPKRRRERALADFSFGAGLLPCMAVFSGKFGYPEIAHSGSVSADAGS